MTKKQLLGIALFLAIGALSIGLNLHVKKQRPLISDEINIVAQSIKKTDLLKSTTDMTTEELSEYYLRSLLLNSSYTKLLIQNGERLGLIKEKRLQDKKQLSSLIVFTNNQLFRLGLLRLNDPDLREYYLLQREILHHVPTKDCAHFITTPISPSVVSKILLSLGQEKLTAFMNLQHKAIIAELDDYPPKILFSDSEKEIIHTRLHNEMLVYLTEQTGKNEREQVLSFLNAPKAVSEDVACKATRIMANAMLDARDPEFLRLDAINSTLSQFSTSTDITTP